MLQYFTAGGRRKNCKLHVKVKVKFTLQQVTKVQRGSRGIAPLILDLDARWVTPLHALAALPPGKKTGIHCTGSWVNLMASLTCS